MKLRIIKTINKQLELAALGRLFIISNCSYVRVSVEHVKNAIGKNIKFYGG